MPGSNCTVYRLLVVPVTSHLNLTRLLVLLNGTLTPQPETSGDPDVSGSNGGAAMNLSSRSQDTKNDFQGAVKFTVAIVFLYGIGVILMLGFHIKKSKWKVAPDFYSFCINICVCVCVWCEGNQNQFLIDSN